MSLLLFLLLCLSRVASLISTYTLLTPFDGAQWTEPIFQCVAMSTLLCHSAKTTLRVKGMKQFYLSYIDHVGWYRRCLFCYSLVWHSFPPVNIFCYMYCKYFRWIHTIAQGVHFLLFSYFFLLFPIFSKSSYFFLFFHSFGIKHRYLHFCSYMTIGATVEFFPPPAGASILNFHSVHIMVHFNIGLTHLKHRGDVCTHLYLHLLFFLTFPFPLTFHYLPLLMGITWWFPLCRDQDRPMGLWH